MPSEKTYAALLRGINVSGRNKVPMKDLVPLCENLAWKSVGTHLQTGKKLEYGIKDPRNAILPAIMKGEKQCVEILDSVVFISDGIEDGLFR